MRGVAPRSFRGALGTLLLATLLLALAGAGRASAASPWWHISSAPTPTNMPPGGEAKIVVAAANLGDQTVNGASAPVTVADKLPEGLEAVAISGTAGIFESAGSLECTLSSVSCVFEGALPPYERLEVTIVVKVAAQAHTGERNEVTVSGGEAPGASASQAIVVDGSPTPFGVEGYSLAPEADDGSPDTQAGSHPFQLTTALALNTRVASELPIPAAMPKDLRFALPPGLIGNANPFPQCTDQQFLSSFNFVDQCAANTVIGVVSATLIEPHFFGPAPVTVQVPLFNLTPVKGEPARFGFDALNVPVVLDTAVRTGRDYGVLVSVSNVSQTASLLASQVTLWGVPGDPRHDQSRGWNCVASGAFASEACNPVGETQPPPFLTLPTSCGSPLTSTVTADSWSEPGSFTSPQESSVQATLDGCNRLPFSPSLEVTPDEHAGSTPTGFTVGVHLPQATTLSATALATSDLRSTTVTLPAGVQLSPAAADGLLACSIGGVGWEGVDATQSQIFAPGPSSCPAASKVATVRIETPLLANPLEGGLFLAAQTANPFSSLLAGYIVAEDPISGVRVKLSGKVEADPATGQLTATFENSPQLPFEDLTINVFGGARAPVSTPPFCGSYATSSSFTPWSGNPPQAPSSSFAITSGPGGSPCPNPQPFAPSLTAGSANLQAGAFTPFTLTMSREDGNQNLSTITVHTPPGLLGLLSSTTPCAEPAAAQGTCGPASLIGHTVASIGLGPDPFTVSGGKVFITGPYKGAPYGLSIAEPATAGPFDLGEGPCDCIVVRAKIEIDPHTSALTVTSDPLRTILQGIPLQIKHVNVTIDRPGFTFNPTNCSALAITAVLSSEQGASAAASVPFGVANCATLPFKPRFTVLTQGRTSKANGASLHVKVVSGTGQANIAKVKVDLPKQLPSRLTTLQKACTAAVFGANPAACPAASVVGQGVAVTPVLKNPLKGPAYLVSHGGAAFPDLVIVLQGEGITLDLIGNTNIKKGITSSSFATVPDAPIKSFDLMLPTGPHSVLASNLPARAKNSLCRQNLVMPTEITGQNGAVIKQSTKIAVSACAKKKAKKSKKAGKARRRKGRGARHGKHR